MIAELVLHLTKEDPTCIHIRLGQEAAAVSTFSILALLSALIRHTAKHVGHVKTHYFSPPPPFFPLFVNLNTAIPSIKLAAEFPKNLLRGFSVPSIRI
jgi:hypothetical protein